MSRVPLLAPPGVDVDVEHFERVMASDRVALLRVAGRWKLAPGERPPVPLLLADDGDRHTRYAPLPQPLDRVEWIHADSRLWWAGYAIPADVVLDPRMRWYLDVPRRLRFELPEPEERTLLEVAESAGVVVRNGRPYLLLACGLAAAALIPLGAPAHASAAEVVPGGPGGPLHRPAPIVVSATPLTGQAPAGVSTAASTTPTPGTPTTTTTTTQSAPDAAGASPPPDAGTTAPGSPTTPGTPPSPPAQQPAPHDPAESKPPRPDPTQDKPHGPREHHPPPHHHKPPRHREHPHPHHPHSHTRAVHVSPAPAPRAPVVSAPTPTVTPTPAPAPALTPQPGGVSAVPDTLLGRFQVPPFLLPIYQAAGTQYGIPWEVLASINEVETNFGRDLSVSSAGAEGWMQFLPSTWATWGVDANLDGIRDPNNPADAIFAAARYLAAAGGAQNIRQAVFAYNHAWWYVDKVMAGAQLLDRVPVPVVDAITGLTQGLFPVPGRRVTYARAGGGWRAAASLTVAGASGDPGAVIHAPDASEAVAVADGRIVATGHNRAGEWIVLEDAFGNRFTYGGLGRIARTYPVVRPTADPPPAAAPALDAPVKERLFAHPERPADRSAGRPLDPAVTRSALDAAARQIGLDPSQVVLRPLKKGARVTAGTILGRVRTDARHPRQGTMVFRVRAGGPRGPMVDPTPLLDGWRLHQRTEALAPNLALWRKRELKRLRRLGPRRTSTRTQPRPRLGIGQMLLLSKGDLARQILGDRRVHLLPADRVKIRGGAMDRRVLAALEYLADSGLRPAAGRADGVAVDVVKLGGARLRKRQGPGTPAADAVHRLMRLQGPARPRRIISRVPAHGDRETKMLPARRDDRVAIAYRPDAHGTNAGRDTSAVLQGGSWNGVPVPLPGAAPVDLANAPAIVSTMVSAADQIAGLPYVWGGGHASWVSSGYDCSGSVSYILHAAGLLNSPLVSGELASWGDPGPGRYVTIYANASHTFMEIGGRFYGTSGFAHLPTTGPDWFRVTPPASYLAGFAVRHPPGL